MIKSLKVKYHSKAYHCSGYSVYQLHVGDAGVINLIESVVNSQLCWPNTRSKYLYTVMQN